MRKPSYLSPTSVSLWGKDRMEFYRKYLCEVRVPRMPQTQPMSVGSAFDAYVKNYLAAGLGMPEAKGELELSYLLEQQVEPQNREWAYEAGAYCFNEYKRLGACTELMKELESASSTPFFESTREARVGDEVPLLGKPDLYFHDKSGGLVIIDWKVNGYCSKSPVSPCKGYVRLLESGKPNKSHPKAEPMMIDGIKMNVASGLEDLNDSWAAQIAIYGWVLGGVGQPIIAGIDQLACGKPVDGRPSIRVASLRSRIGEAFQDELWAKCREIWSRIQAGNIFDTDNDETIAALDSETGAYLTGGDEDWYTGMMRKHTF